MASRLKTPWKLAGLNYMFREPGNASLLAIINGNATLKQYNQDMVTILGAIASKAGVPDGVNNITSPPPFPCDTARWNGTLAFDTTTKTSTVGAGGGAAEVKYKYDHQSAMALNAQNFRGYADSVVKLFKQLNDMTNSANNPNPGGQAGTHGKLAPYPGLNAPKPVAG